MRRAGEEIRFRLIGKKGMEHVFISREERKVASIVRWKGRPCR